MMQEFPFFWGELLEQADLSGKYLHFVINITVQPNITAYL